MKNYELNLFCGGNEISQNTPKPLKKFGDLVIIFLKKAMTDTINILLLISQMKSEINSEFQQKGFSIKTKTNISS